MKKFIILLLSCFLIAGLTFVSCNSEVSTPTVSVSFAPATTKAINQSGTVQSTDDENVNLYHWEYAFVQGNSITVSDSLAWTEFYTDKSKTGLGNINGLVKNSTYSFALRGYTTGTDGVLMWEGSTESGRLLSSKKTVITIKVNPKGKGMIYFDIDAPVFSTEITTSGTDYTSENNDKFKISWVKLGDTTVKGEIFKKGSLNTDGDAFEYNTVGKEALMLDSGSYLFTIQQYEYNEYSSDTDYYDAVTSRKQVLIVDAMSGMDTVLSGSLDSEALTTFNYDAGAAGDEYGIEVEFKHGDTSSITQFLATVYNADGTTQVSASKGSHLAEALDGEVLSIKWTSNSDLKIYVNGDEIKTSDSDYVRTENGYLQRIDGLETLIKTSGTNCLLCDVSKNNAYIVSFVYTENSIRYSVSFTVCTSYEPVMFTGTGAFAITAYNSQKSWDGTLYYDIGDGWVEWDGKKITVDESPYQLRMKGVANTIITGLVGENTKSWTLTAENGVEVSLSGDITSFFDCYKEPGKITVGNYALAGIFANWKALIEAPAFNLSKLSTGCYEYAFKGCTGLTTPTSLSCTELANSCYCGMFQGCTSIDDIPDLPATTLAESCYSYMFSGCNGLTSVPELKATTLAKQCYSGMFSGCTSLVNAPILPAMVMCDSCYSSMFSGCSSLITAPELPSTELAPYCYSNMFANCTSLVSTPNLPAMTMKESCYKEMFADCNALTITTELNATTLAKTCYASMFTRCKALEEAPALPALSTEESCYSGMFTGCLKLTSTTDLPATSLALACYEGMFSACKALESAPAIQATTIGIRSCQNMFMDCTALTYSPDLNATSIGESGCSGMFYNCTSLKTAPAIKATTIGKEGCAYMFKMENNYSSLETVPALNATKIGYGGCTSMFENCVELKEAPSLPATSLGELCYSTMFKNCTKLTTASDLPATSLPKNCYQAMFTSCVSLKTAPAIKATSVGTSSCYNMFINCSSLTSSPDLNATSIGYRGYMGMFYNCTSLKTAPAISATSIDLDSFQMMFSGCSSLKITNDQSKASSLVIDISKISKVYSGALTDMFKGTSGSFTGTPSSGCYYNESIIN